MCVYIILDKVMVLDLKGYAVDYVSQAPRSFRTG